MQQCGQACTAREQAPGLGCQPAHQAAPARACPTGLATLESLLPPLHIHRYRGAGWVPHPPHRQGQASPVRPPGPPLPHSPKSDSLALNPRGSAGSGASSTLLVDTSRCTSRHSPCRWASPRAMSRAVRAAQSCWRGGGRLKGGSLAGKQDRAGAAPGQHVALLHAEVGIVQVRPGRSPLRPPPMTVRPATSPGWAAWRGGPGRSAPQRWPCAGCPASSTP